MKYNFSRRSSINQCTSEMDKWKGKIAVVTGGSSGIGAAFVKELAKNGINVIGLARRHERIEAIAKELGETPGKIYARQCDVTDLQSIKNAFKWIEETFDSIHILVNNSGCVRNVKIFSEDDGVSEQIDEVIRTNFNGLVHVSREGYRLMKKSNDYGYIININSNLGHRVPFPPNKNMSHNVYQGSKYAVTATSEIMRMELICEENDKIRVTVGDQTHQQFLWQFYLIGNLKNSFSESITWVSRNRDIRKFWWWKHI